MSLTTRFWGWVARKAESAAPGDIFAASRRPGELGRPLWSRHKGEQVQRYTEYTYACVRRISDAVAQVPLRAYYLRRPGQKLLHEDLFAPEPVSRERRAYLREWRHLQKYVARGGELMEVTDHPVLRLFAEANPHMDGYFLAKLTVIYLSLTGESYTWVQADRATGTPTALYPLPAQWTDPVVGKEGTITGYKYGRSAGSEGGLTLRADEVIYHREPNPLDVVRGYAPLAAVAVADSLYESMNLHEDSLFRNRAEPGGLLVADKKLMQAQRETLRAEWEALHRGTARRGRVAVLDGGLKWQATEMSPKELSFLKGRPATIEEMAAGYGVPLALLRTENVNKANAEVGEQHFARYTIRPTCILLEQKWNQDLVPRFDERLFLAHDDPVTEDRDYRLSELEVYLKNAVTTVNEQREAMGKDAVPWGDRPLVPMNIAPLGSSGAPPKPAPAVTESRAVAPAVRTKAAKREDDLTGIRRRFRANVMKLWRDQRQKVVGAMPKSVQRAAVTAPDIERWLHEMSGSEWAERWGDDARGFCREGMLTGGNSTMAGLPTGVAFNIDAPAVIGWLDKEPFKFAAEANGTTVETLRRTLTEGMEAAEPQRLLIKRVDAIFGDKLRAERIARTETAWAYEQGGLNAAKQSGVVRAKVWRTTATACEFCQPYEGMEIALDSHFASIGDDSLPGADTGKTMAVDYRDLDVALLHVNCQCYTEWVVT